MRPLSEGIPKERFHCIQLNPSYFHRLPEPISVSPFKSLYFECYATMPKFIFLAWAACAGSQDFQKGKEVMAKRFEDRKQNMLHFNAT